MKKKAAALAALALAGVMILTACSSSEQESDQQSAAKNDTIKNGTEVQTEEPLQAVSGTQSVSGTAVSVAGESGSTSDATATAPAQSETAAAGGTQTAQTSGTAVTEKETESESADGDIWSGTYVADDETLTIAMAEDTQISFSFAEAGISGVADVRGSQAVYKGDDHYVIVFNINGTLVDVSVSSEEDYDASDSPLIGTYVKDTEQ
mgnify:CR=1 FL=1